MYFLQLLLLMFLSLLSNAKPKAQNFVFPYNFQTFPFYFGGYYPIQSNPLTQYEKVNQQLINPYGYHQSSVFNNYHLPFPAEPPTRLGGGGGVGNILQPYVVFVPVNPMYQFWNPSISSSVGIPLPDSTADIRGGNYGPNICTNQFQDTGNCYRSSDCTAHGGHATTYCTDFSKMCCIVPKTCGATSSANSTYFRNANWPLGSVFNSTCSIEIEQAADNACVRVTMSTLTLPASTGYCDGIAFQVSSGSGGSKQYEPLCGSLAGNSYELPFGSSDKIIFELTTTQKFRISWKINILQLPSCDFTSPWPAQGSASGGSGSSQGGASGTQPASPVGPGSGKPAKAPTVGEIFAPGLAGSPGSEADIIPDFGGGSNPALYATCGLSGTRSQKKKPPPGSSGSFRLRDHGQIPTSIHGCISPQGANLCRDPEQANPLLQSLDWNIPVLSSSLLYKYAGTAANLDTRITYGVQTQPHEYPWAVAMYSNGRFHCGGSLISDRHVLTAAHCVVKQQNNPNSLNLSIGDWNINSQTDGKNVEGQLAKIVTHPGYSTVTLKNDVAVLTLKNKVTVSDSVRPICLPATDLPLHGKLATVTGWGRDQNNKLQSVLMKLSANIVTNADCDSRWVEKGAPAGIIVDSMMCMDAQFGDSCKGDSGGPSIMEYPADSGKFIQVGIVSFGSASCTDKNLPGVYTNVGKLVNWIKEQMV